MSQQVFPPACPPQVKFHIRADIISACETNNVEKLTNILAYASGMSRNNLEFRLHWVDFIDSRGYNPLMTAVFNGSNSVVGYLLTNACATPARLDCGHRCGTTATHVAAYRSNLVALELMQAHANPYDWANTLRHQDTWGKIPLHHAYYHQFQEGIDFLSPISPEGILDSSNRLPSEQSKPEGKGKTEPGAGEE